MKKLMLGLVAVTAFGSLALPASAGPGNSGNIQDSYQRSYITGNDNASIQESRQSNQTIRDNARGDDVSIQRSAQDCDVYGNANVCVQRSEQIRQEIRRQRQQ